MKDSSQAPEGFLARWSRRKGQVERGEAAAEPPPALPVRAGLEVPIVLGPPRQAPPARQSPSTGSGPTESGSALAFSPAATADDKPPAPTLDDVAQLSRSSDFRRFVASDVTPEVKNAAMKKLFSDPHFNVMDGLDTYIDDYGKPDPIPPAMLRQMVQSKFLGLFDDEDDKAQAAGAIPDGATAARQAQSPTEPTLPIADDQNAAVRLQPLDAAGPPCDPGGAGQDAGRER